MPPDRHRSSGTVGHRPRRQTAPPDRPDCSATDRTFRNHLNTLHLNRLPKAYDKPRKTPISLKGKTVLVADAICTSGRSLDVARAYIATAGGYAILFSWLKTINTSYSHMTAEPELQPFATNSITKDPPHSAFLYHGHIVDPDAPQEIGGLLAAYKAWKWP